MKRAIQLIISLAITGACLAWTFKSTNPFSSDPVVLQSWHAMVESARSVNLGRLAIYLLALTLIHVARTIRWGNWLSGIEKVPFSKLNEAAGIGFMMLIILPFRLGEFARPYLIADRSNIRRSAAMTSVVFERIIDGLIIAVLLRVLLFFVHTDSPDIKWVQLGSTGMFAVFGGGLLFLLFARWQHERAVTLISATFGRINPKLGEKVGAVVDGFVGGTKQLPNAANMAGFFFWTAVYWVANGCGTAYFAGAFDCQNATAACQPLSLTTFQGFVVLSVLIVGMMIPAAPGSAGTFQACIKLGLSLFVPAAVVNTSGVAFSWVLWLVQISWQILFGVVLMLISHRSFKDLTGKMKDDKDEGAEKAAA